MVQVKDNQAINLSNQLLASGHNPGFEKEMPFEHIRIIAGIVNKIEDGKVYFTTSLSGNNYEFIANTNKNTTTLKKHIPK